MNKILDAVEDIKPNITENQYNKIMEGLNEIFPLLSENRQLNRLIRFFNWLDTKLEITNDWDDSINRKELYKYIKENYKESCNSNGIIKLYFEFTTNEQTDYNEFKYVKYRH